MRATARGSEMAVLGALFRYIDALLGMGFRAAKLYHGRRKTPIIRLGPVQSDQPALQHCSLQHFRFKTKALIQLGVFDADF